MNNLQGKRHLDELELGRIVRHASISRKVGHLLPRNRLQSLYLHLFSLEYTTPLKFMAKVSKKLLKRARYPKIEYSKSYNTKKFAHVNQCCTWRFNVPKISDQYERKFRLMHLNMKNLQMLLESIQNNDQTFITIPSITS